VLIERFLNWLNEDTKNNGADSVSVDKPTKHALLGAPKAPLQITQRSLPSPHLLSEIAVEYDRTRLQISNEQYEAFFNSGGYAIFVQWVESLIEKSAAFGGPLLLLTFDNSTGIATATTPGPREILPPASYAMPISHSAVRKLVAALADHFQKAGFGVQLSRHESTCSRFSAQFTPAYDCLDILWAETKQRCASPQHSATQHAARSLRRVQEPLAGLTKDGPGSYQTARLSEYLPELQARAWKLFEKIKQCVGESRAKCSQGSFSVVSSISHQTVAKIIIFENGLGKANGDLRDLPDGLYVLVRASGAPGDKIWNSGLDILTRINRNRTIAIAPKHTERFAYALVSEHDKDNEIASILRDCLRAADSASPRARDYKLTSQMNGAR
jgi:hypothetical protein